MAFYAHITEPSSCEYTIGCGERLIKLDATTTQDAVIEIKKLFGIPPDADDPNDVEFCIDPIAHVDLLVVSDVQRIDTKELKKERKEAVEAVKKAEAEANERSELERLARKYGHLLA